MRLLIIVALAACGARAYEPRGVTSEVLERYKAVCYAADPAVILGAVSEILRAHNYDVTHTSVPGRWLWATRGESYISVRLKPEAHCTRIDLVGGFPHDPMKSFIPDFLYSSRYFYPLIRRRLARVADGRPLKWQRQPLPKPAGSECRRSLVRCQ